MVCWEFLESTVSPIEVMDRKAFFEVLCLGLLVYSSCLKSFRLPLILISWVSFFCEDLCLPIQGYRFFSFFYWIKNCWLGFVKATDLKDQMNLMPLSLFIFTDLSFDHLKLDSNQGLIDQSRHLFASKITVCQSQHFSNLLAVFSLLKFLCFDFCWSTAHFSRPFPPPDDYFSQ